MPQGVDYPQKQCKKAIKFAASVEISGDSVQMHSEYGFPKSSQGAQVPTGIGFTRTTDDLDPL